MKNAERTNGPFASLQRARDAVRILRNNNDTDMTVLIRGGVNALDRIVMFGLNDLGEEDSVLTYAAYPGEEPVFSSGQVIEGWQKVLGGLAGLPEAAI